MGRDATPASSEGASSPPYTTTQTEDVMDHEEVGTNVDDPRHALHDAAQMASRLRITAHDVKGGEVSPALEDILLEASHVIEGLITKLNRRDPA
jgi:hypothetical protein